MKINNFKQLIKNDCQDTSLHRQEYHIINFKGLSSAVPIFSVLIFKEVCVCVIFIYCACEHVFVCKSMLYYVKCLRHTNYCV